MQPVSRASPVPACLPFNQGVLAKLPWPELGSLGALEELNLAANKISMIPDAAFLGLSSLKILSINDNRLVRLGSLTPLTRLEELRLSNNNLEEMPDLGVMPRLTVLELSKNRIAAIPSGYFANTPAVEKLLLSANLLEVAPASLARCASRPSAVPGIQRQLSGRGVSPGGRLQGPSPGGHFRSV